MCITYDQYIKARYSNTMPHYTNSAINAVRFVRADIALDKWKREIGASNYSRAFTTDSENIAHEYETQDGYKMVFKVEADYNHGRDDDITGQGYDADFSRRNRARPDFADHGEFTRHMGDGLQAYIDCGERDRYYGLFTIPEKYMRQFYDNKNYGKHDAYINMVASTRLAIEQDIKNAFQTEYCYISVTVFKDGEEVFSDGIGSVDDDYAVSGRAFLECCYPEAMDFIAKDREERGNNFAACLMASRPDMYATY